MVKKRGLTSTRTPSSSTYAIILRYKVLAEVIFLDELPRNPPAKVAKRELRKLLSCSLELTGRGVGPATAHGDDVELDSDVPRGCGGPAG